MVTAQYMAMRFRQRDERLAAHPEQLRARLELRRSNAAVPHRSKRKYTRTDKAWKRED